MNDELHRCNMERTMDGVRICFGGHARHEDCQWVEYVPKAALAARDEALRPFVEVAEAIMRRKSSMRPYSDESLIVSTCGKAIVWKHLRNARAAIGKGVV